MDPLKFLHARIGTFFTTGNHEYYYGSALEWFDHFNNSYGITILDNKIFQLNHICFVGLNDLKSKNSGIYDHTLDLSAISKCKPNSSIIVMAHNPVMADDIISYAKNHSIIVDLILSGHTHFGQIYPLILNVYLTQPYLYGWYNLNNGLTKLLISAGTLYLAMPMKMLDMSEIWLLTLTSDNQNDLK
uniref:Calcineurin-like phosphoesterase domain-containing protein n=1 Tax=Acrobeloides nanus TaxID=290746 RepID=A0A914E847_9BILA